MNYEPKEEIKICLIAVGDVMLGEHPLYIGHGIRSVIQKKGAEYPFIDVAPFLKKGDIVFGNLEAVLSDYGANKKQLGSMQLRAVPETVEGLKYAGFNMLSLANNHILEHGKAAVIETKDILSRHGIKHVGVGENFSKAREPEIMSVKGIDMAFLSYCLVPDKTAYISINDPREIASDVRRAKSQADLVVVSLHWGNEYIEMPSPFQIELAHDIVDSGANIILGHHPHVLQPVETYKNSIIAYSLGNFIFDMDYIEETKSSIILECELTKERVVDYNLAPVYLNNHIPTLLEGESIERRLERLNRQAALITDRDMQNYESYEQKYLEQLVRIQKKARKNMMRYFISNIYRYPPRFTFQIIMDYLGRYFK
jgi:poly-gamma-glutamate synthesis protein (capsule biosynthesis protein)